MGPARIRKGWLPDSTAVAASEKTLIGFGRPILDPQIRHSPEVDCVSSQDGVVSFASANDPLPAEHRVAR